MKVLIGFVQFLLFSAAFSQVSRERNEKEVRSLIRFVCRRKPTLPYCPDKKNPNPTEKEVNELLEKLNVTVEEIENSTLFSSQELRTTSVTSTESSTTTSDFDFTTQTSTISTTEKLAPSTTPFVSTETSSTTETTTTEEFTTTPDLVEIPTEIPFFFPDLPKQGLTTEFPFFPSLPNVKPENKVEEEIPFRLPTIPDVSTTTEYDSSEELLSSTTEFSFFIETRKTKPETTTEPEKATTKIETTKTTELSTTTTTPTTTTKFISQGTTTEDFSLFFETEEPVETTTHKATVPPAEVASYCEKYAQHNSHYCKDPGSIGPEVAKFCSAYNKVCAGEQQKVVNKEKLQSYCNEYNSHYQYFCHDPLEHGPAAITFCPSFAKMCKARLTGEKPIFDKNGEKVTQKPQKPKDCTDNEALANQYCFRQVIPSFAVQKCNLYKTYCL